MDDNYTLEARKNTTHNRHQGNYKKVLTVCSAGLLRSPTAAWVLSNEPYNYNTRSAGSRPEYALNLVDEVLIEWADEIVFMQTSHLERVRNQFDLPSDKKYIVLNIPDDFCYRDPTLINLIKESYDNYLNSGYSEKV